MQGDLDHFMYDEAKKQSASLADISETLKAVVKALLELANPPTTVINCGCEDVETTPAPPHFAPGEQGAMKRVADEAQEAQKTPPFQPPSLDAVENLR